MFNSTDIPLRQLNEEAKRNFDRLRTNSNVIEEFDEYFNCDESLICDGIMDDDDIVEHAKKQRNDSFEVSMIDEDYENEERESEITKKVTNTEMRAAVKLLSNGLTQRNSIPEKFFSVLNEIDVFLELECPEPN